MAQVSLNLMGYARGNAQMTAEVWDPATNLKIADAPVLADGTVQMRNIPAGAYQIMVRHADLISPVATQTIYVAAAGSTPVSILIDPIKFKNSAIADVPTANLDPLAAMAQSLEVAAGALASKMPGEILTAAWANGLALAIRDLAHVVAALSRSVTPVGHEHLEYENKINEVSGNVQTLVQTLAESTLQIQRQFDIRKLRDRVDAVLEAGNVDVAKRTIVLDALAAMEDKLSQTPALWSASMRTAGNTIQTALAATVTSLLAIPAAKKIAQSYNALITVWINRVAGTVNSELNQSKLDRYALLNAEELGPIFTGDLPQGNAV